MSTNNRTKGLTSIIVAASAAAFLALGCSGKTVNNQTKPDTDPDTIIRCDKSAKATLLFAGDAMQHQAQLDQAFACGEGKRYDYSGCFTLIAPIIKEADYAVVNLEVPLAGGNDYSGYPCFSAPDSYAKALKDSGFDLFLTANNHCLDRRDRGARRTLAALDSLGIAHCGTFTDSSDRVSKVPMIVDINGIKTGFLNYTYGTNGIEATQGAEIALIDRERMAREIELTRNAGAEILVVALHWGIEYVLRENSSQRSTADFLKGKGVDLIIGGHPHVIQPMEMLTDSVSGKKTLVVYSLGNLISNMKTADTRGGAWVKVDITRDSEGNVSIGDAVYDTFITQRPERRGENFRVVPSEKIDSLPASQRGNWKVFNDNAERIFSKYNKGVKRNRNRNNKNTEQ